MARRSPRDNTDVYLEGSFWKLRWREDVTDENGSVRMQLRAPVWIGPATGPMGLTKEEARLIAWENFLSRLSQNAQLPQRVMTVAAFVENIFVPEHVATKELSGRTHFHAILKHVLVPEEVDRVFHINAERSKSKLKAIPNWPYLDNLNLQDARPDDVQRLISAALERGYSPQTVKHIRNVVGAIFTHAKKKQCLHGDNPASLVTLPGMTRKEAHVLTLAQAKELLSAMHYPEKEVALTAILTGMTVAEICGLQWKRVNLTAERADANGEKIPPGSIAVRNEWYRGELASVKKGRNRNLPIPDPLLPVLLGLSRPTGFVGPDDFVLVSRAGTPVNAGNLATRQLKAIGRRQEMPWLSWQVLRRTHRTLAYELGIQLLERMASAAGR